jgi:hypothetical protein
VTTEPLAGRQRLKDVTRGRLTAAHNFGRLAGCLAAGLVIAFALAACAQEPQPDSGRLSEFYTGVVLASPAKCVRVTQPVRLSVLGLLCLQHSPGRVGSCVHGVVDNGGKLVGGITWLPGTGHYVAATKCKPSPALAPMVRENQIIGVVWTDPRCLAVPLPYPGSRGGLICAAHPIGTAGECARANYRVPGARSGGGPFDGRVIRSQPAWCKNFRRW